MGAESLLSSGFQVTYRIGNLVPALGWNPAWAFLHRIVSFLTAQCLSSGSKQRQEVQAASLLRTRPEVCEALLALYSIGPAVMESIQIQGEGTQAPSITISTSLPPVPAISHAWIPITSNNDYQSPFKFLSLNVIFLDCSYLAMYQEYHLLAKSVIIFQELAEACLPP